MSRNQRQGGKRQPISPKLLPDRGTRLLDSGKRVLRNAGICSIQASGSFFRARICQDQESRSPKPLRICPFPANRRLDGANSCSFEARKRNDPVIRSDFTLSLP